MRILVIEDDDKIASVLRRGFESENHAVTVAVCGAQGAAAWAEGGYDAVVLDRMLPDADGLNVLREARTVRGDETPVVMLSAKGEVDDRIEGLDSGADDYLAKPFSFSELLSRIQAVVRRVQVPPSEELRLVSCGVVLHLVKRTCMRGRRKIELLPREFALLELMMRNAGRPLTKSLILERIWNMTFDPQTNVVDVLVCKLRAKLDSGFDKKLIKTIRGVGYVFGE